MINGFRAGMATPQTGLVHGAYTKLQYITNFAPGYGVAGYDTGGEWDNFNFQWKPQAGLIDWKVQCWIVSDYGVLINNNNIVVTCFKNGVDWSAELDGAKANSYPNSASCLCVGDDYANGTDIYDFRVFYTSADGEDNGATNGDPRHMWLYGKSYGAGSAPLGALAAKPR